MRYYFDISTSARWEGPAVGIVRVERELGKRAREHLGDALDYCVYDLTQDCFRIVPDDLARQILDAEAVIDFGQAAVYAPAPSLAGGLKAQLRRAALMHPLLYQSVQRLRGHHYSLAEIRSIKEREAAARRPAAPSRSRVKLADIAAPVAELDAKSVVISGGLDWEHKRLKAIWQLKQTHGFKYWAIVYDLIAINNPQWVVPGYVELLREYFGELLWVADGTMCISEATRREVERFSDESGVPSRFSRSFPLGCDVATDIEPHKQDLPDALHRKSYALFVSTIEPRKNHRAIYEAWAAAMRQGRLDPERHRLVFAGRKGWAVDDLVREITTNPLTRDTILILNHVRDDVLAALYRNCAVTLFPSHYEGYGLPVAEALHYGRPCISSNAGALSEIGSPDLVLRLDPLDILGWAEQIALHLNDAQRCDAWAERIRENFAPVRWAEAADAFFTSVRQGCAAA